MTQTDILIADRSWRGKLRVSGEQRAWFLHQVLTQAFEDMAPGDARDAAMITVHGRMTAYLEAVATSDAFLVHFEPQLRDTLPDALARYVFATRVEIADVTEEMGLVLVVGDGWGDAARQVPGAVVHPTTGMGVPAAYLWVERDAVGSSLAALRAVGATDASEERLEAIRIAHGAPRWGYEMDERTFPQEAAIDERAVHYDKGCYLGQEAMAKIHFRGKVNRRLRLLEVQGAVAPGDEVVSDGAAVGVVSSAADGRALALLRHTVEPGLDVAVGSTRGRVLA